jgi:hypothetical protein
MNTFYALRKRCRYGIILSAVAFLFFGNELQAQEVIGEVKTPEPYSLLELSTVNRKGGLRLPPLTTAQRNALNTSGQNLAKGLVIYNIETNCIDYWNGTKWESVCESASTSDCSLKLNPSFVPEVEATGSESERSASTTFSDACCEIQSSGSWQVIAGSSYAQAYGAMGGSWVRVEFAPNYTKEARVALVRITNYCGRIGLFIVGQKANTSLTACGVDFTNKTLVAGSASGSTVSSQASDPCCPSGTYTFTIVEGSSFADIPTAYVSGDFTVRFTSANTGSAPRMAVVKAINTCGNVGYFTAVQAGTASGGGGGGEIYYPPTVNPALPEVTLTPGNYRYYFAAVCAGSGNVSPSPAGAKPTYTNLIYCTGGTPSQIQGSTATTLDTHAKRVMNEAVAYANNDLILQYLQNCNSGAPCSRPNQAFSIDFTVPIGATEWKVSNIYVNTAGINWNRESSGTACSPMIRVVGILKLD